MKFAIPMIDRQKVLKFLSNIDINKASGTDMIGPRLLKFAAPFIADEITFICNQSISKSVFPSKWKEAKVTPLLAHLSRRLIGELIVYPWSGVRRPSVVVRRPSSVRPQCSNIFFSETAWLIKAKFYVEPPWVGGTKFCSRHLGHMTKMAATPIYGKNPSKIFFSRTSGPIFTKLGM